MADRKALRFLLSRFTQFSHHSNPPPVREVRALVSMVTDKMLDVHLPTQIESSFFPLPAMYCEIYDSPAIHASIFGLRAIDDVIPLHDHPQIHGYIKVLQGAFEITTFSWVTQPEKIRMGQHYPVVYEGTRILTADNDAVHLAPIKGNVHQIRAIEDGSFFFDLLIPGYKDRVCSYFRMPDTLPVTGTTTEIQNIYQPLSFECAQLYYETIKTL